MKQPVGGTIALLGLILYLCESDNLVLCMACGGLGIALMAAGAGIAGAYITNKKVHRSTPIVLRRRRLTAEQVSLSPSEQQPMQGISI